MNDYPTLEDKIFDLIDFPKIYTFKINEEGSKKLPPNNTPVFSNPNLASSNDSLSKWDMNNNTLQQ